MVLGRFVAYLKARDADRVIVADAVGFATAPPARTPRTQALRLSAIRCFTRWSHCQDPGSRFRQPGSSRRGRPRVPSCIYTAGEVQALLQATDTLRPGLRATTYRTLIELMAATGIRTGEALGLNTTSFDT